jgi:hypothetical protein
MSKSKELTLGGVYCGRRIAPGVYAEKIESGRYLIRRAIGSSHAERRGEVVGSSGTYQALTMTGECVAREQSLRAAALALKPAYSDRDYVVSAWFERDRKSLRLSTPAGFEVLDLWDEDINDLITSGFLTHPRRPRPTDEDWRPHLIAYARENGLIS